jgi:uncharacterized repeat protein (TIGR03803 family)
MSKWTGRTTRPSRRGTRSLAFAIESLEERRLLSTLTTLASFNVNGTDGSDPFGGLILSGSTLYGTAQYGYEDADGEVFSVPVTGGTITVLASFNGTDGNDPSSGLILSGSTLYGTTQLGGFYDDGVVFSLPVTGGTPTVLTSFDYYTDGEDPQGGVILSGSTLYGTTYESGDGEVFSLPTTGGTPTVLASFDNNDGEKPSGDLILSGGTLYGTTEYRTSYDGEVFSEPTTGGTPTVLASFNGTDGANPQAGVILSGSTLYGTTGDSYADYEDGAVFSVPVTGGTPTVLAVFDGTGESSPQAGVVVSGSTLYGTAEYGGADGEGEVFSLPTTGGTPTALASFNGTNGDAPGGLLLSGSTLYGTTTGGGAYGEGTVFELSLTGFAATDTWTGTASSAWSNPGNWSAGTVPGSTTNVAINNGTVIASVPIDVASLTLNDATLQLASNSGPSTVSALTITSGGTLDVTNNSLTINYASGSDPKSTILSYLSTGSNGGAWNGTGIISSTAATNTHYGVGYADGADGIDGNLTSGQIELAYVQYGDIGLQGLVNAQDFSLLTQNFGKIVTVGWEAGDFTYSGIVNAQDFSLLTSNFGQTETGEAVVSTTPTVAVVANALNASAPTSNPAGVSVAPINEIPTKKPKPFAAAINAANVAAVPFDGSAAPLQDIDKDAKFFADR